MILPADFDWDRPDDELIEALVAAGPYGRDAAADIVAHHHDPDAEPLE